MKKPLIAAAALATMLPLALPLAAQDEPAAAPSPGQIVNEAPDTEWARIPAEDLLVMTLAPDAQGKAREVVIQLMPEPFSQGWVHNIRLFARSGWYDDISVNRVQDNYVVQWGDPNYDNPEADGEPKPLPEGLKVMTEADYTTDFDRISFDMPAWPGARMPISETPDRPSGISIAVTRSPGNEEEGWHTRDAYAEFVEIVGGWPIAGEDTGEDDDSGLDIYAAWPVHCYGMVGVGRNYSPDAGSGAELYTVIGQAPRHLDRNIALVGRIIAGMEHLTALPRGSGALGFYTADEADKRTLIRSVRVASDVPVAKRPSFEQLKTGSEVFERYVAARAARSDPFFIEPAGGIDICNIPVPIRPVGE